VEVQAERRPALRRAREPLVEHDHRARPQRRPRHRALERPAGRRRLQDVAGAEDLQAVAVHDVELAQDRAVDQQDPERAARVGAQQLRRPPSLGELVERADERPARNGEVVVEDARGEVGVGVDERDVVPVGGDGLRRRLS
jgi:hypothetical protein